MNAEAEEENKVLLHLFPSDPISDSGLCTVSQAGRIQKAGVAQQVWELSPGYFPKVPVTI